MQATTATPLGGRQRQRAGEGLGVAGVVGEQFVGDGHGCSPGEGVGRARRGRGTTGDGATRPGDRTRRMRRCAGSARTASSITRITGHECGALDRSGQVRRQAMQRGSNRRCTLRDMWEPVGPLPAAVYWRRRGVAAAVVLAVTLALVWAVSAATGTPEESARTTRAALSNPQPGAASAEGRPDALAGRGRC